MNGQPARPAGRDALSPGFHVGTSGAPSYELKFRVDPEVARRVLEWGRAHLAADVHGDPDNGGAYAIHTLYLDTAALDVYHRSESFRRRKFRVRRYGEEGAVYLEQKTRTGDRVSKRRVLAPGDALDRLARGEPLGGDCAWFARRTEDRRLRPVLRMSYLRTALIASREVARLTVDESVRAAGETHWALSPGTGGVALPEGLRILELKFQGPIPRVFKDLLATFGLQPVSVSKYRLAVDALGLVAPRKDGT